MGGHARHGPPDWRWSGVRIGRAGIGEMLVLAHQRGGGDLGDHEAGIQARIGRQERRQIDGLSVGSTISATRRCAIAPISAMRQRDLVGGKGHRLGMEIAARNDRAVSAIRPADCR